MTNGWEQLLRERALAAMARMTEGDTLDMVHFVEACARENPRVSSLERPRAPLLRLAASGGKSA